MVDSSQLLQPGPIYLAPVPALQAIPATVCIETVRIPYSKKSECSVLMLPSVLSPGEEAVILSVRTSELSAGTSELYSGLQASASVLYVPGGSREGQIRSCVSGKHGHIVFRGIVAAQETGFFAIQTSDLKESVPVHNTFHGYAPILNRSLADLARTNMRGHLEVNKHLVHNSPANYEFLRQTVLPYLLVGLGLLVPVRGIDVMSEIFRSNKADWLFFELLLAKLQVAQLANGSLEAKLQERNVGSTPSTNGLYDRS